MRPIPVGARGSFTLRVRPEHLASRFKDPMLPNVLATPVMILAMENAALDAIRGFLDAGESAVGTAVDVRRVEFKVSARDETEEIGRGTHQRMVVDVARMNERVARKAPP